MGRRSGRGRRSPREIYREPSGDVGEISGAIGRWELSRGALTELSATRGPLRVSLTILKRERGISLPSSTIRPPKNQWRECSELDCPMSKHSTSVGSRFSRVGPNSSA